MTEKKAYSPKEFAALFGKEKTWTYRLIYAGKLAKIDDYGRTMIPASEADRIAAETDLAAKKKGEITKASKVSKKVRAAPAKGNAAWSDWIERRKKNSHQTKGLGKGATKS